MSESIIITEPVREICARLGLDFKNVGSLSLTPSTAKAEVYLINESGSKYIRDDGEVAKETRTFKVRT